MGMCECVHTQKSHHRTKTPPINTTWFSGQNYVKINLSVQRFGTTFFAWNSLHCTHGGFCGTFFCYFLCHLSCSDLLNIKLIWCSTHKSICRPLSQHRHTLTKNGIRHVDQKCRYVCVRFLCVCSLFCCAFMYSFPVIHLIRYDSLHLSKLFNIFFSPFAGNGLLQIETLRKYASTFSCPVE